MGRPKKANSLTPSQRTNEWRKKNSVAYTIKLNKNTQGDVIIKLDSMINKTQYIVNLIREDINHGKN